MTAILWVVLPILIALGSALLAVYIMQQRLEVQLARERQSLSEARASIQAQKDTLEEVNHLREEVARRQSLDDFLSDLRTEQRRFIREQKMGSSGFLVGGQRVAGSSILPTRRRPQSHRSPKGGQEIPKYPTRQSGRGQLVKGIRH